MTTATKTNTKPAILKALADLAGAAHTSVPRAEVRDSALAILGVTTDSLGTDARGRSKADRLINACFNDLKKSGLCDSPLRGKYALTDSGWTQATGLTDGESDRIEAILDNCDEPTPTPTRLPVVTATSAPTTGSSVAFKREAAPDAYLLSLQIASSPCFGVAYSTRSKVCKGCPVATLCQSARAARLSELAAQLARAAQSGAIVEVAPSTPTAPALPEGALTLPIDHEVECDHCHKALQVGSEGILIPDRGMFHQECISTALAA
jgi:hypothetical protein